MSAKMKKATGWVQRMKQMQETGIPFHKNLFVDTCLKYQSLNSWEWNSQHHLKYISAVEFSNDGSLLATGAASNRVAVWPIGEVLGGKTPNPILMLDNALYYGGFVSSLALSQDNRRIFSSATDSRIIIHDLESNTCLHQISDGSMACDIALPFDDAIGDIFASASSDGVLRIFDLRRSTSAPVIKTLKGHCTPLLSVMYSPKDLTQLATSGRLGAQVIDFRSDPNKNLHHFPTAKLFSSVKYNGKGTRLLCSEENWIVIHDIPIDGQQPIDEGTVKLRIAMESCNIFNFRVPRPIPSCFAGKDDELVVAGVPDGKICIWSVPDGRGERNIDQPLVILQGHDKRIVSLQFSPQNCALASCGLDDEMHESFKVWTPFNLPQPVCDDYVEVEFSTEDGDDGGSNSASNETMDSSDQSAYYYSSSNEEEEDE